MVMVNRIRDDALFQFRIFFFGGKTFDFPETVFIIYIDHIKLYINSFTRYILCSVFCYIDK